MRREKHPGHHRQHHLDVRPWRAAFITAYCASKGALITLTKNVAFRVMRHSIRVNGLTIGWMDTPGEDRIMKTYHGAEDGWRDKAEAGLPTGRLLKPDEVARAVAYLSSEESGLMTGSIIDFDQSVARLPTTARPSQAADRVNGESLHGKKAR